MKFRKKLALFLLISALAIAGIFYAGGLLFKDAKSCLVKTENRVVRGTSLAGLIKEGEIVKVIFGYYNCNEVMREDIAAYKYVADPAPIIKIIKAVPEDRFELKEAPHGRGWNIYVNGALLKNSLGLAYLLDKKSYGLLALYERDYKNTIPENAYLLLSNISFSSFSSSFDSRRYGLVGKNGILGKVIKEEQSPFKSFVLY